MGNATERRRFLRAAFHGAARLSLNGSSFISIEVVDMSPKGALVSLPKGSLGRVGDDCSLKLDLGDNAQIAMAGVVVHVQGQEIGIRCDSIDLDSATHLRRLIELNSAPKEWLDYDLVQMISLDD